MHLYYHLRDINASFTESICKAPERQEREKCLPGVKNQTNKQVSIRYRQVRSEIVNNNFYLHEQGTRAYQLNISCHMIENLCNEHSFLLLVTVFSIVFPLCKPFLFGASAQHNWKENGCHLLPKTLSISLLHCFERAMTLKFIESGFSAILASMTFAASCAGLKQKIRSRLYYGGTTKELKKY